MTKDISESLAAALPHTIHGHYVRVPRWAWNGLLLVISLLVFYLLGGQLIGTATDWNVNKRLATLESAKIDKVYDLTNRVAVLEAENRKHDNWRASITKEVETIKSGVEFIKGRMEATR